MKKLSFEALKDTRFLLSQSEMRARSEVKRSVSLESCKSFRVGFLPREVEKCKVDRTVCYGKIIDKQKEESG